MRLVGLLALSVLLTQQPTFKGGVELVTVDVRVTDADGAALLGLLPGDFELKIDGKTRPVVSMHLIQRVPSPGSILTAGTPGTTAEKPRTPTRILGRNLILLFDHENIRPSNERAAVVGAARMLDRLNPGDRVALITLPNGRIEVNLTTDFNEVRRALRGVIGRNTDVPGTGQVAGGCSMNALLDVMRGIQSIEGPKAIVFVSEGWGCGGKVMRDRLDNRRDPEDLASLAAATRAQFYVVQPNNSMQIDASRRLPGGLPDADVRNLEAGLNMLEDIAGVTGGDLFRLSGTADGVFERIVRETAAYYELAFEPLQSERNGKDHAISVKLNRPKVTVRARSSFIIPTASRTQ